MKTRILTALAGIPLLIYVLLFSPLWVFGIAMGVICAIAAYEMMHMALGKTPRRLYFSAMSCAFAMPVFTGSTTAPRCRWTSWLSISRKPWTGAGTW